MKPKERLKLAEQEAKYEFTGIFNEREEKKEMKPKEEQIQELRNKHIKINSELHCLIEKIIK